MCRITGRPAARGASWSWAYSWPQFSIRLASQLAPPASRPSLRYDNRSGAFFTAVERKKGGARCLARMRQRREPLLRGRIWTSDGGAVSPYREARSGCQCRAALGQACKLLDFREQPKTDQSVRRVQSCSTTMGAFAPSSPAFQRDTTSLYRSALVLGVAASKNSTGPALPHIFA